MKIPKYFQVTYYQREIRKYFELNDHENTTYQQVYINQFLKENIQLYIRKDERFKINGQSLNAMKVEKDKKIKTKSGRRKEIIKRSQ